MNLRVFDPLDLEVIEQAYQLACDRLVRNPLRDATKDREREKALRETLFFVAQRGDDASLLRKSPRYGSGVLDSRASKTVFAPWSPSGLAAALVQSYQGGTSILFS